LSGGVPRGPPINLDFGRLYTRLLSVIRQTQFVGANRSLLVGWLPAQRSRPRCCPPLLAPPCPLANDPNELSLGKPSKLDQHGLSDAALSVLVPVNKFPSTRHLNPLCNSFLMQPMGAAYLIQHPLCNLFGRHFSFAKKMLLRDNTGPALAPIAYRETHGAGILPPHHDRRRRVTHRV
jgi:hypothetical protein